MYREIATVIVFFMTYTLHSITGFAGNALAFPLVSLMLGVSEVKVIMNGVALLSAVFIFIISYKYIDWKEIKKILIYVAVGVCAGYIICLYLPSEEMLLLFYGLFVVIIAIRNLLNKEIKDKPRWWSAVILSIAGLVQGMFLSGGPVLVIYTAWKIPDKKALRATNNFIMLVIYIFMNSMQLIRGEYTGHNLIMIGLCVIPLALGTWLGTRLMDHLNRETFLKLVYILLLVLGVLLIVKGIPGLSSICSSLF